MRPLSDARSRRGGRFPAEWVLAVPLVLLLLVAAARPGYSQEYEVSDWATYPSPDTTNWSFISSTPPVEYSWEPQAHCGDTNTTASQFARADRGILSLYDEFNAPSATPHTSCIDWELRSAFTVDDVVFTCADGSSQVTAQMNLHVKAAVTTGTNAASGSWWGEGGIEVGGFGGGLGGIWKYRADGQVGSPVTETYTSSGMFTGTQANAIDGIFTGSPFTVPTNSVQTIKVLIKSRSRASYGWATMDMSSGDNGASLPLDGPVFDLPEGCTCNSVKANIVDNHWLGPVTVITISGTVSSDCRGPMENVTVDLLDYVTGDFYTTFTDASGAYEFTDIPQADSGEVSISIPLGYQASTPGPGGVELAFTEDQTVDFALTCLEPEGLARSMGYWKHQANVWLTGHGSAQETEEAMRTTFPQAIFDHFYDADLSAIEVEGVTYMGSSPEPLDLETLAATLTVNHGGTMLDRAKQQYLAMLLNIASGKLATYSVVSDDGATASQALQQVAIYIADADPSAHEAAKDIADTINNALLVAAGVIDLDLGDIPYAIGLKSGPSQGSTVLPSATRFVGVSPSPFRGMTSVRFELAEAALVSVDVYSVSGLHIRRLVEQSLPAGRHAVSWDGRNDAGRSVSPGVYYVNLQAGTKGFTQRAIVIR